MLDGSVGGDALDHDFGPPMTLDVNALDSISATLQELTDRIGQLVEASNDDEDALAELREVERQLQTSTRRLAKIVRRVRTS